MKIFSHRDGEYATVGPRARGAVFAQATGMTTIPRDSDILGAAALLAVVLLSGLFRTFGL